MPQEFQLALEGTFVCDCPGSAMPICESLANRLGRRDSDQGQDARVIPALVADATGLRYLASLRNEGAKPLFLVIGMIMANDKWLCPDRIELWSQGQAEKHKSTLFNKQLWMPPLEECFDRAEGSHSAIIRDRVCFKPSCYNGSLVIT